MSWNVESLGAGKATTGTTDTQSEVVGFLNQAIQLVGADIVGVMEIKSGLGQKILDWLLAKLNNPPLPKGTTKNYTWDGRVSARQDGSTQEESLLLWKGEPSRLALDLQGNPGPVSLIGVVDKASLANALTGLKDPDIPNLYKALENKAYLQRPRFKDKGKFVLTKTWRVDPAAWTTLSAAMTPTVDLTKSNPPAPKGVDAQALAAKLINVDMLRFPTFGQRSPMLGNFLIGAAKTPTKLMTLLLHAPGPQEPGRADAINIIALSSVVQGTGNLLMMGDWNIVDETKINGDSYQRSATGLVRLTAQDRQPVFAPITGPPVKAQDLMGTTAKTSLTNTFFPDATNVTATLVNPYDRFFFRTNGTLTKSNVRVVYLHQWLAPAQAGYDANLATAALTFFKAFRGAQFLTKTQGSVRRKLAKVTRDVTRITAKYDRAVAAKKVAGGGQQAKKGGVTQRVNNAQGELKAATAQQTSLTNQDNALTALLAIVNSTTAATPSGIGTAHAVYRHAVSDHLPIAVDLSV